MLSQNIFEYVICPSVIVFNFALLYYVTRIKDWSDDYDPKIHGNDSDNCDDYDDNADDNSWDIDFE